jgi:hypothetical protein
MQGLQFVPYKRLGFTPNIIVDSQPLESTLLTLSHWPGSGSPPELKADLSAEIVFNFLETDFPRPEAEAISNNHFDEDGLVGLFALLNPQIAQEEKDFLLDVATAGDFGTFKNREAAHVTFVLQAWAEPARSPLNRTVFQRPYDEITSILYEELLPRFSNLFQRVHFLEQYWKDEDTLLEWSEAAIESGEIKIEEYRDLDFAVVQTPGSKEWAAARPQLDGARWTHQICHQYAVHNVTDCSRILVSDGNRHDFYYRYETWVELVERKPLPRLDLKPLAARLNALENKKIWRAEGVEDIVPHLSAEVKADSKLSTAAVKEAFIEFFTSFT